jgi:hypothetical protein
MVELLEYVRLPLSPEERLKTGLTWLAFSHAYNRPELLKVRNRTVMTRTSAHSRGVSALALGVAGLLVPVLWFFPVASHLRDPGTFFLYGLLPGVAAGIAGAVGAPFMVPGRCRTPGGAAVSGAVIALASILLFAPLFAVGLEVTEPQWHGLFGIMSLVVFFSLVGPGWVIALAGACAGWIVWSWIARRTGVEP